MGIKRIATSVADRMNNKVDQKMLDYVSKFVYEDATTLENAISIYLCLGDVLRYNTYFCLNHDYNKTSMVRDINLENNEIICKSWAILYHRLLKCFGIKSKVSRNKAHYKVEIELDGVYYSVDATNYGGNSYFYSMSDITRIKCNLMIDGFLVSGTVDPLEINKFSSAVAELKKSIDRVYERQNRLVVSDDKYDNLRSKVSSLVQKHSFEVGIGSDSDINYRIKLLNRFWGLNLIDSNVEKVQLFNSFYKSLFEDLERFEYQSKAYNVFTYENGRVVIYKLLAIEINGIYSYYLEDGKKFNYYDKNGLLKVFNKKNIRVTEFTEIMGLSIYMDMYRARMK